MTRITPRDMEQALVAALLDDDRKSESEGMQYIPARVFDVFRDAMKRAEEYAMEREQ